MLPRLSVAAVVIFAASAGSSFAAGLVPHEAVYELKLASQPDTIASVDARIALQLKPDGCEGLSLDYRFVARFHQSDEITVTDQQTLSRESRIGDRFEFETKTLVDGAPQETVKGTAENAGGATRVAFTKPVERKAELPLANFPLHHTNVLIESALAGKRVVEAKIFDGDNEPDKNLTTTALIVPTKVGEASEPNAAIRDRVEGLRSWRITESYFNDDSNGDGLPIFETRYRLYENGVTDELYMDFGDYALAGKLGRLEYLADGTCTR